MSFFKKFFFYSTLFLLPTQLNKYFFIEQSYILGVRKDLLAPFVSPLIISALLFVLLYGRKVFRSVFSVKSAPLWFFFLINLYFSQNTPATLFKAGLFLLLAGFVIALKEFRKEGLFNFKYTLFSLLVVSFIQFFLSVFQFWQNRSWGGVFYFLGEREISLSQSQVAPVIFYRSVKLRSYGTFSHPNSLAGFMLFLYLWGLFDKRADKYMLAKVFLLFFTGASVLLSFSRPAILLLVIFSLLYFWRRTKCFLCRLARSMAILIAALIFLLVPFFERSFYERIFFTLQSIAIISEFWITGVGLGAYLTAIAQKFSQLPIYLVQPVHNIFLLYLAETGILGLLAAFYAFFTARKKFVAIIKERYYLFISLIVLGFFDHYFLTLIQNIFSLIFIFL